MLLGLTIRMDWRQSQSVLGLLSELSFIFLNLCRLNLALQMKTSVDK